MSKIIAFVCVYFQRREGGLALVSFSVMRSSCACTDRSFAEHTFISQNCFLWCVDIVFLHYGDQKEQQENVTVVSYGFNHQHTHTPLQLVHTYVFNHHNSQSACSIIQTSGVGTVDLKIYLYFLRPFFELLVKLKENEKKRKPS